MTATQLSVFALWTATTLYAIAMVSFSWRLAKVSDLKVEQRRKVAVGAGARVEETDGASTEAARVAAKTYGIGRTAVIAGLALHTVGVVARAIASGHVPWSNMYEVTISGALVMVAVFVTVQLKRDVAFLAPGVTLVATVALGVALVVFYGESTGLQPALQSYWLVIHVSVAVIAMGVFAVAAVSSVLQLMQHEREDDNPVYAHPRLRWLEAVPNTQNLEALAFRLNALGFVAWTFTLIAGAIWAEHSWGRYWGWDPKEVWTFVIWVIYAAYLHARTTQGWSGRRAAWLGVAGFIAVVMNFTVVNWFFPGKHSYAAPTEV